jgi:hypothetical protein
VPYVEKVRAQQGSGCLDPLKTGMANRMKTIFEWLITLIFLGSGLAYAGPYLNSVHGDTSYGVLRQALNGAPNDYAQGNCAHCHEQHASIGGVEPDPAGSPSAFALFADNFDENVQTGPYSQQHNFCFYCHTSTGALQSGGGIINNQYVNTFGGYDIINASNILDAFKMGSYHNLYDIKNFSSSRFSFFRSASNPCAACHNPHLAKRNKEYPTDPAYTAISRPTSHEELWGDDANERMSRYTYYRPPYYYGSSNTYEPLGTTLHDGSKLPDYNTFCLDCHQYEVPTTQSASMNSATPAGYLTAIDWSNSTGDMHGERTRVNDINGNPKGFGTVIAPYNTTPVQGNYVLSCLDCHEPHGTVLVSAGRTSSYLLRKEANNNVVDGCGPSAENFCETDFCGSCHTFDHCGGPQDCIGCHYHGAENINCGDPWTGPNF